MAAERASRVQIRYGYGGSGKGWDRQLGRATPKRWAEKTPANIFYFREMLEYFQGCVRLVECIRDGRDVVTSVHPKKDDEPWVPVNRWIDAVLAGRELRDHPNVCTIRYEDLVEHPMVTVKSLYEAIDLPTKTDAEGGATAISNWHERATVLSSENLVDRAVGDIHKKSLRKWEQPNFPFRDRIEQVVSNQEARDLLKEHGYL